MAAKRRYYKVRAVNPGPAPGSRGGVTTQDREKRTGVYTLHYFPSRDEPRIVVWYRGDYAGGKLHDVTLYFDSPESGREAWTSIRGDYDVGDLLARHGYDEYGNRRPRGNPKGSSRRNVTIKEGSITLEEQTVLEDLARAARESDDDWGIQQGVREYLDEAYGNRALDTPRKFLDGLHENVMWNYEQVGDEDDDLASAKRAQNLIAQAEKRLPKRTQKQMPPTQPPRRRSIVEVELAHGDEREFHGTFEEFMRVYGHDDRLLGTWREDTMRDWLERGGYVTFEDGDVLRATKWSTGSKNPRYRYAAVPVDDDGSETAHVVRGRRRADMVRQVARSVPGDAMVDLGRTRTFATKHEATRYAEKTSPRVRVLSRRVSEGGR